MFIGFWEIIKWSVVVMIMICLIAGTIIEFSNRVMEFL